MTEKKFNRIIKSMYSLLIFNIGMAIGYLGIANSYAERVRMYLQFEISENLRIEDTFWNTRIYINDHVCLINNDTNLMALMLLVFNVLFLIAVIIISSHYSKKKLDDT